MLSARQREALALLSEGLSDRQIAERMGVGIATARQHVLDVRTKLGATNRGHAVVLGYPILVSSGIVSGTPRA